MSTLTRVLGLQLDVMLGYANGVAAAVAPQATATKLSDKACPKGGNVLDVPGCAGFASGVKTVEGAHALREAVAKYIKKTNETVSGMQAALAPPSK